MGEDGKERGEPDTAFASNATRPAIGLRSAPGDHGFPPGATLGKYVVLGRIGGGGMGVVYSAYDRKLDRRVALKLLRPDATGNQEARLRLVREAQALAKLAHPNVVSIHDVGELGELGVGVREDLETEVFLEMEFVEGGTLGQWLQAARRGWRETLAVFVKAGRGLAAAHAVGVVHRDFKPDNVLLGGSGREMQVKVADFGIARAQLSEDAALSNPPSALDMGASPPTTITVTGTVHGTPAYMSPEQRMGAPVDARSDQFTFCLAVYEALFGERPRVAPQRPPRSDVPAWVWRTVVRGLSLDPERRYPSMDALLEALSDRPRRRARLGFALVSVVASGLLAGGAWAVVNERREARALLCSDTARGLQGAWDDEARAAVRGAFTATGASFAGDAWRTVESDLDGYTTAWAKQREEACRATRIRREQTEDVLALRTACLDRRRDEVAALVSVLRHADRDVVTHAIHATEELAPLDLCTDWRTLASRLVPPSEAVKDAVAATRQDLARSKALLDAGSFHEALALAEAAMDRAKAIAYLPLRAEAGLRLGAAQQASADMKSAEATLRGAVVDAEAAGDERTAAEAWGELVVVDAKGGGLERGPSDAAHADAIALHLADDELRAEVAEEVGTLLFEQGKFAESEARYGEALAIEERRLGPDHPRVAALLANLTDEKVEEGHMDGALDSYARSLAILERAYGPHHPEVARTVHSMGVAAANLGDLPGAEAYFRRTVQVNEDALGPEHPTVARSLIDLASILRELDVKREPEAKGLLERALSIQTKALGPEHADVARTLEALGEVAQDLGDADGARADFVRGLAITEKALGPEHRRVEDMLDDLARLDLERGQFAEAEELGKRALAIVTKALGEKHPYVADSLTILGRAYVGLHRAGEAIAPLERALALRVAGEAPKDEMAETRFALATALWDAGKDRDRARALAVQAQAALDGAGAADVRARAAVDEWLRARSKA